MIDLHLHTTASDGSASPEALVERASAAGIQVLAVTDHDTLAALPAARRAARAAAIEFVPGIEITAIDRGRDVHVLGYFVDAESAELAEFLARQRTDRRRRVIEMIDKLDRLGVPVDPAPILAEATLETERALGRPMVAAALVAAGHVADFAEAFDRYLGYGRPAFVARVGASPGEVIATVDRAGGVASLAHPGKLGDDSLVDDLIEAGLPAIEVYHPDHDADVSDRYARLARDRRLLMTGGSDYHGPETGRIDALGRVGLAPREYAGLRAHAVARGWRP